VFYRGIQTHMLIFGTLQIADLPGNRSGGKALDMWVRRVFRRISFYVPFFDQMLERIQWFDISAIRKCAY